MILFQISDLEIASQLIDTTVCAEIRGEVEVELDSFPIWDFARV